MLPFVDLTLLSANTAAAIVFNGVLSIWILKEKFVLRYDLPGMALIAAASITIALNAHKDQVSFSGDEILDILISKRSVIYLLFALGLVVGQTFLQNIFL